MFLERCAGPAAVVAAILGFSACSTNSVRAGSTKEEESRKVAPDFSLKDADGRAVRLSEYRGKVVLLDFWATWCGPCKIEIPWFMQLERENKDRGFAVLGVAMDDEGWSAVKPFLKDMAVNYRVVMGDDKTADQYGGIEALPTTFLIDRNGRVAFKHEGLASKKDFQDAIEKLLQIPIATAPDLAGAPVVAGNAHGGANSPLDDHAAATANR